MGDGLRSLLEPAVLACGFEVWDVSLSRAGGRAVLEVLIDRPDGVSLDDCREVSMRVAEILDAADPIPGELTLEVASPGIERRLRNRGDLQRFEGSLARIATRAPGGGLLVHEGRLRGVRGDVVRLRLASGEARVIPIGSIRRANLLYHPEDERIPAADGPSERATGRA